MPVPGPLRCDPPSASILLILRTRKTRRRVMIVTKLDISRFHVVSETPRAIKVHMFMATGYL